ncbi:hypothetical protein [Streptomyces sp. I4(2020)]|nr:hypothetical protein [Streptomyces sp. I4(2020)]MBJ6612474.1 hypothetical protein [Streptomyces sp. I3(2020)]MBJ6629584.1 hypothetical protein [Streptomyces sp. I4(2020)]
MVRRAEVRRGGEQLTPRDVFTPEERDRLVTAAVERIVPDGWWPLP